MSLLLLVALVALLIFILGVLCGCSWTDQLYDARSRRQATRQRQLNNEFRVLREQQDARAQVHVLNRRSAGGEPPEGSSRWPNGPVRP
jgi:cell division protein FtsL